MVVITPRLVGRLTSCRHRSTYLVRRSKVTFSIEPPPVLSDGYVESPGVIALLESTFYRDSWSKSFASTFPDRGIHFLSVDVFSGPSSSSTVSESFAHMHTELAADLSPHAEVTLVARGPLPCLVAQYFLESLPLSALILVDPLIVPRRGNECINSAVVVDHEMSLPCSARSFAETSSHAECFDFQAIGENEEAILLGQMQRNGEYDRPLKLEAGVVPVKVLYTGSDISHEGEFRRCAEQTASYHTPEDKDISMWGEVVVEKLEGGDDLAMETIFAFYDNII